MECMIVLTSEVAHHCLALLHENISWWTTVDAKTNVHAHDPLKVPLLCIFCTHSGIQVTYVHALFYLKMKLHPKM